MKRLFLILFLLCQFVEATNYFLAPSGGGGNDSNNGTSSGTPWLSPNHAVNCGDVITAASGTYSQFNFGSTNWGTVTCAAGNNVAWIKCATFDACKIAATAGHAGMWISTNYWGVQGWEVSATGNFSDCFNFTPTGASTIHHVIFANNVCNGGGAGIVTSSENSTTSTDYIAFVGNISWNASQSTSLCASGLSIFEPIASDTQPGTHIYVAGNFSFDNASPTGCLGSATYDGNGIVFDDWGNVQSGGAPYAQQAVIDNNITVFNGGNGIGLTGNGTTSSHIYIRQNTVVYNYQASNTTAPQGACGDLELEGPLSLVEAYGNLTVTKGATGCLSGTQLLYGIVINNGDATNHVYNNFIYSAAGHNVGIYTNNGFVDGPNEHTGTNPSLVNVTDPGQPSCGSASSVPNCMATVIANFTPSATGASSYGYQIPLTTQIYDSLFPQWLCSVTNIPTGLVTMGCLTRASFSGSIVLDGNIRVN
jgi:hypothetical protein